MLHVPCMVCSVDRSTMVPSSSKSSPQTPLSLRTRAALTGLTSQCEGSLSSHSTPEFRYSPYGRNRPRCASLTCSNTSVTALASRPNQSPRPPRPAGGPRLRQRALFDQAVADRPQEAAKLVAGFDEVDGPVEVGPDLPAHFAPALPAVGGLVVVVVAGEQRPRPTAGERRPAVAERLGDGAGCRRRTRSGARGRPRPRRPSGASSCRPDWPSRGTSRGASSHAVRAGVGGRRSRSVG